MKPPSLIGLRTLKTGLAVALAVLVSQLLGSPTPVFAAIGAIMAMSRTVGDSWRACLTQLVGITCGCVIGCVLVLLLPATPFWVIGLGMVLMIVICLLLKIQYAIPLACIVLASVCLYTQGNIIEYSVFRFVDTALGLFIALGVNIVVKPYNNHRRITALLGAVLEEVPRCLEDGVLKGRYPDLLPLQGALKQLEEELVIYEQQSFPRRQSHRDEAVYLRGCQQLAVRMEQELLSICGMDVLASPSEDNLLQLRALGLSVDADALADRKCSADDRAVLNYHLADLLSAYEFLQEMNPEDREVR